MVIYGPKLGQYDIDVGPVFLSDWYHGEYFELVKKTVSLPPGPPVFSDNNLINGKGDFDCSKLPAGTKCTPNAGLAKFKFTKGKRHRLRLINGGGEGTQRFSIDGHELTVIANDFVPCRPYKTNVVTLGIGQRTDVVVEAKLAADTAVWMRSNISTTCSLTNQPFALAAIYYDKADNNKVPTSSAQPYTETGCGNDDLDKTIPLFPFPSLPNPATTQTIDIGFGPNATGNFVWTMNGQAFRGNYDQPTLLLANAGNTSYPYDPQWNVYNFGTNASVRIIIRNTTPVAHPMHLHGHNFNVLAEGQGTWDGKVKHIFNTQRRDVQIIQGSGYLVIQYNTDNPGVWPLHCHIAWHVSAGLYVNVMEQTEKIKQKVIPDDVRQTCRDWADYTGHTIVNQIDSGL